MNDRKLYKVFLSDGRTLEDIGGVDEQDTEEIIRDVIASLNILNKGDKITEVKRELTARPTALDNHR